MILFFSATGNTKYIAKRIASVTGDEVVDLFQFINKKEYPEFHSDKPFVLAYPVHACSVPIFLRRFLKKCKFSGSKEMYIISTAGRFAGAGGKIGTRLARRLGFKCRGYYDFNMGSNYLIDKYYYNDLDKILEIQNSSLKVVDQVANVIKEEKELVPAKKVSVFWEILCDPVSIFFANHVYSAKKFYASDSCMSCGFCAKKCVLSNISMKDGKPAWGKNCVHCMACIDCCPKEAIEYGEKSAGKLRYTFDKCEKYRKEISSSEK